MNFTFKNKSGLEMINDKKQIDELLPQIVNFFPHNDALNSCKLIKHFANLLQTWPPFSHESMMKRLAAIVRQENNTVASFLLRVMSKTTDVLLL